MRKRLIISLWFTIILISVYPSFSWSTYYTVCIDPGHGGIHYGSTGPVYGVREKNANLAVGLALKNKIEFYVSPVLMTRTTDITVYNDVRAAMANDSGAAYFISVHHNGDTDTSVNGTETYYCNAEYTEWFGGLWRGLDIMYGARDSTFAKKVRLALRDSLHHTYRCSPQHLCGGPGPCCMVCYDVLRNTIMQSTLSEASFITNPWVEEQFYYNTGYIAKEAGAICKGWWSTYLMGGLGIVKNAYSTGSGSS
jgi:N-acetylmuramoyl-L-alanine amidase